MLNFENFLCCMLARTPFEISAFERFHTQSFKLYIGLHTCVGSRSSRSLLRTVPVSHHFDLSFFFTFNPLSSGRLGGSHRLARILPIEMNAHELSCTPVIRVLNGPIGFLGLRKLDEMGNQDITCLT